VDHYAGIDVSLKESSVCGGRQGKGRPWGQDRQRTRGAGSLFRRAGGIRALDPKLPPKRQTTEPSACTAARSRNLPASARYSS